MPARGSQNDSYFDLNFVCCLLGRLLDPAIFSGPVRQELARLVRRLGFDSEEEHLHNFYDTYNFQQGPACPFRTFHNRYRASLTPTMPRNLPPYTTDLPNQILFH